jgi:hypothetical protein
VVGVSRRYRGLDTETHRFGPCLTAPPLVCATFAPPATLLSTGDPELEAALAQALKDPSHDLVLHNAAYDLAVIRAKFPALDPLIWDALEAHRIHDTLIREKLLVLAIDGDLDFETRTLDSTAPPVLGKNGKPKKAPPTKKKRSYALADLAQRYLGKDRFVSKGADGWRLHYAKLDGIPSARWPKDARDYALDDAVDTVAIAEAQDVRAARLSVNPFVTEPFRVAVSYCLYLMSAWGVQIDPETRRKLEESVAADLDYKHFKNLIESGILSPAETVGQPYKRQTPGALAGTEPIKRKAPLDEKISMTALREHIAAAWVARGFDKPVLTEKGLVATDSEVIDDLIQEVDAHGNPLPVDPALVEYERRQSVQKLVSTEIPRMGAPSWWPAELASYVHPKYDVLKATGRTSSFADKNYPSANIQNVDPRARACYVPRKGHLFCSADYKALELVALAQKTYSLLGWSVLRDKINAGVDPHAFLGAQIALGFNAENTEKAPSLEATQAEFRRQVCLKIDPGLAGPDDGGLKTRFASALVRAKSEKDLVYNIFNGFRKFGKNTPEKQFFDHFRKFAKPTGLGYPGGLGAATFVTFAKATYGVKVTLDQARELKTLWIQTYPEMKYVRDDPVVTAVYERRRREHEAMFGAGSTIWNRGYFDWVTQDGGDAGNGPLGGCLDPLAKNEDRPYFYRSPMGVVRSGATYCAAANGAALQTPGAEAACTAVWRVVRACYDPRLGSCLYGCRPIAFVHDEIILELPDDEWAHERAQEFRRIMEGALAYFMPDIKVQADPCFMRRWNKDAEPVFDEKGRLKVWEPTALPYGARNAPSVGQSAILPNRKAGQKI